MNVRLANVGMSTDPALAPREPVSTSRANTDMLAAAELGAKIWIDFEEWK